MDYGKVTSSSVSTLKINPKKYVGRVHDGEVVEFDVIKEANGYCQLRTI